MPEFSYHPAALRAERVVAFDAQMLRHDDGPIRAWAEVSDVSFAIVTTRGDVSFVTLTLTFEDGATEEISLTGPSAVQQPFFHNVRDLLVYLDAARPDLRIALGPLGGGRVAMFLVGLLLAATGLGLMVIAIFLLTIGDLAVAFVMGPVGVLTALAGSGMAIGHVPGRAPQRIAVADLIRQIDENA